MSKTLLLVFGTRPEAIKMAPLVQHFTAHPAYVTRVCVTAQHRQMLDQVLALFDLQPDYDLDLMRPGQDLFTLTSRILTAMGDVLAQCRPDLVFVHGDTTTCFTTALAAFYQQIAVAHVEAGLRTRQRYSPFPEEMNRRLASRLATLHFAPTTQAQQNLVNEGVDAPSIYVTGNTIVEALRQVANRLEQDEAMNARLAGQFPFLDENRRLILVTAHRRESFGGGFEAICRALHRLAERTDVQLVYPVHLNPNVAEPVRRHLAGHPRIHLLEPLDYLPFVYLMNQASVIVTDSGGVQEEAPSLGKPVLVLRESTERPEALQAGTVRLVGTNEERIVAETTRLLDDPQAYAAMARAHNPYGDGKAAQRMVEVVHAFFEAQG